MDARPAQDQKREVVMTHGVMSENPEDLFHGRGWRVGRAVLHEAVLRLWSDDAFGMAGNVAFRALLAIFPFLIFTSSLTAFVGDRSMADDLIHFLIAIVPPALIEPIVS
ncbi:MAG: YhjD/YihY/BrkB family envelope integrity protein, partial [Sulfitobacter dubius]